MDARDMDPLIITVKRTGPYVIAAEDAVRVRIVDHEGNVLAPEPGKRIALCRCGGSATKPFCDATHKRIGFCQATDTEPQPPSAESQAPRAEPRVPSAETPPGAESRR